MSKKGKTMSYDVKKNYAAGSPGFERKEAGVTLNSIQKEIKNSPKKAKLRRDYRKQNMLGPHD